MKLCQTSLLKIIAERERENFTLFFCTELFEGVICSGVFGERVTGCVTVSVCLCEFHWLERLKESTASV